MRLFSSLAGPQLITHVDTGVVSIVYVNDVRRHSVDYLAEYTVSTKIVGHHLAPFFVRYFFSLNLFLEGRKERVY